MVGDDRKTSNAAPAPWEGAAADSQNGPQKGANIARKRNALGRGLNALMTASAVSVDLGGRGEPKAFPPPAAPASAASSGQNVSGGAAANVAPTAGTHVAPPTEPAREAGLEGGLIYLSIDRVMPNKKQPRQHFVQAEIDSLADSIRKTGLLQPIVVRRRLGEPSGQLATYEIVAGERRWRAAKQAGLVKIPALLRQLSDRESLEIGIVENVQRADLNPVEEAIAYQRLADEFGASQAEIAARVGKDRVSITNALRLLKLPSGVQQLLISGKLSAGHGRAVLMLDDSAMQAKLAERIQQDGLSVRASEQLAAAWKNEGAEAEQAREANDSKVAGSTGSQGPSSQALEERLRRALGTKVKLSLSANGKGEVRISFFSSSELERILERLNA